jgi:hypothetical protein
VHQKIVLANVEQLKTVVSVECESTAKRSYGNELPPRSLGGRIS